MKTLSELLDEIEQPAAIYTPLGHNRLVQALRVAVGQIEAFEGYLFKEWAIDVTPGASLKRITAILEGREEEK